MELTFAQMVIIGIGYMAIITIFLIALLIITKRPKPHTTWCGMATCGHWLHDNDSRHRCKISPIIDGSQRCISYTNARCARTIPPHMDD
jgi:hypothetical protein